MKVQPVRAVFESLKDPLGDRRRGQALGGTLRMVFLARVSGENSERGIAAWVEEQRWRLKGIFGFRLLGYNSHKDNLQIVSAG